MMKIYKSDKSKKILTGQKVSAAGAIWEKVKT